MREQLGIDTFGQIGSGADAMVFAEALELAVSKIEANLPSLIEAPASWGFDSDGDYSVRAEAFDHIDNWTTSFFTGMALVAFQKTGDRKWLTQLDALEGVYREKVCLHGMETMHDLGFLFSLFSVGLYRLTGEAGHRKTGLLAAGLLADRFIPEGGYIRAWGRMDELDSDYCGLAIIDSMMNLPLLYWASEETGDGRFRDIAVRHTNTTLRHFVRPDGSVYHAYRFDPKTGSPSGGDNYCGRTVDSHWARGSAWAMFGFALGYRYTGDVRYLDVSILIMNAFLRKLGSDSVPVWDFALEEGERPLRDSSAAAIAACAIQELEAHDAASRPVSEAKIKMLRTLCSKRYLDVSPSCRGLLREGQVAMGRGGAQSVYTSWGDFFFMQALAHECGGAVDFW